MESKKILTAVIITIVCGAITASAKSIIDVAVLQSSFRSAEKETEVMREDIRDIKRMVEKILILQGGRK